MSVDPAIPLSGWADRQLAALADATGSRAVATLSGAGLLGERAALHQYRVQGLVSAGGGCRLYPARDGWIALSLARADDRALLPALFGDAGLDPYDDDAVAVLIATTSALHLVAHGAELGLAIAADREAASGSAYQATSRGAQVARTSCPPLVVDLSSLWAGPLATHLLEQAGATVIKVESTARPDTTRTSDPALFALLNQDKASVVVDLRTDDGRAALCTLIRRADIVVEASRPRALLQLGIDADALVAEIPGLVWVTVTGHGAAAPHRIGFGDDCGVAGGLTGALYAASGAIGFVGDAVADPLTGIAAARLAWAQWASGRSARLVVSMSGVVAAALAEERTLDAGALDDALRLWAATRGDPLAAVARRAAVPVRDFGADTGTWLR